MIATGVVNTRKIPLGYCSFLGDMVRLVHYIYADKARRRVLCQ